MVTCGYVRTQTPPHPRITAIVLTVKGWITRITICLLLGAITTITVAWGCAVLHQFTNEHLKGRSLTSNEPSCWWLWRYEQAGSTWVSGYPIVSADSVRVLLESHCEDGLLPANSWFRRGPFVHPPAHDDYEALRERGIAANGWPMRSMWCAVSSDWKWTGQRYEPHDVRGGGLDIDRSSSDARIDPMAVPLYPIWMGFLVDTLFYSGLWPVVFWLFNAAYKTTRSITWSLRGLCRNCGYDLRGDFSTGCSECGCGR